MQIGSRSGSPISRVRIPDTDVAKPAIVLGSPHSIASRPSDPTLEVALRQSVPVALVSHESLLQWPPSDATTLKTCRGGSKATVEICNSDSVGKYAKKYVHPDIKENPAEWKMEQGRLQNDWKTYQALGNMGLGDTFGSLYHHTENEDEGLMLYLEYAGSHVLANHVMSDFPENVATMTTFFDKITMSITDMCDHGISGDEASARCKDLFLDRIINRLKPSVSDLAPLLPNAERFVQRLGDLSTRWETIYTRLEPVFLSGNVAPLPTDTTFLNMMVNPDTGVVKCIDPGKIDMTSPAYPLSKMLVFGPYYRFVNDKEFSVQEGTGFMPTKSADIPHTGRVLESCQTILAKMDSVTATQTIVAGLIQFGGDLGYRYNAEDIQSGKTFADVSLFDRALTHLGTLVGETFHAMGMSRDGVVSEENKDQFSKNFVACRARDLAAEVELMLPVGDA